MEDTDEGMHGRSTRSSRSFVGGHIMTPYRIAVTGDQAQPDGSTIFGDIGLGRLTEAGFEWRVIPADGDVLTASQLTGYDALLMMGGKGIDSSSFDASTTVRHIARFGAGYDAIDVDACSRAGVLLTNAPEAVRRPMASAAVTMVLALAHNLVAKDRLVRDNRWFDRSAWQGRGIGSRTVGIVGFGSIGVETARLFRALDVTVIAYNRSDRSAIAETMGVTMLSLDDVVAHSDFLVLLIAANAGTNGFISATHIASMKPDAYLVNLARGSIIDEPALVEALEQGRIAGAGLDVFQGEPLDIHSPLIAMENVILTPHSLSWTDEFASAVADSAISALLDFGEGRIPQHAVNAGVLA
jgi:D-3-phosphoglycerate dehydrogenase